MMPLTLPNIHIKKRKKRYKNKMLALKEFYPGTYMVISKTLHLLFSVVFKLK